MRRMDHPPPLLARAHAVVAAARRHPAFGRAELTVRGMATESELKKLRRAGAPGEVVRYFERTPSFEVRWELKPSGTWKALYASAYLTPKHVLIAEKRRQSWAEAFASWRAPAVERAAFWGAGFGVVSVPNGDVVAVTPEGGLSLVDS